MYHKHQLPCLHYQPQEYIRMVQHLIERCLLFRMSRDDCVKALAKHARIEPVITLTVWRELHKENKGFFEAYFHALSPRPLRQGYAQRRVSFKGRNQWQQFI